MSKLIFTANQLTGFYKTATLAFNELRRIFPTVDKASRAKQKSGAFQVFACAQDFEKCINKSFMRQKFTKVVERVSTFFPENFCYKNMNQ